MSVFPSRGMVAQRNKINGLEPLVLSIRHFGKLRQPRVTGRWRERESKRRRQHKNREGPIQPKER